MEKFEITEDVRKVLLETAEHYEGLAACLRALCSEEKKDEDDGQLMLPLFDEEEKPAITLEQVRGVLAGKSRDGFTAEVRGIIAKHGAKRLSDIDPKDFEAVMKEAEELGHA